MTWLDKYLVPIYSKTVVELCKVIIDAQTSRDFGSKQVKKEWNEKCQDVVNIEHKLCVGDLSKNFLFEML